MKKEKNSILSLKDKQSKFDTASKRKQPWQNEVSLEYAKSLNATQPTNLSSVDCHADFGKSARNDGAKLPTKSVPKLAIVIPCYNEEEVISHTYKALCDKLDSLIALKSITKDSFLCFVDDGSRDKTCEILLRLKTLQTMTKKNTTTKPHNTDTNAKSNPHKIVKLSKNCGHQNALLAGLAYAKDKCDCVVSMDCDLQDDINLVDRFVESFANGGYEVIYGVRNDRKEDSFFKRFTATAFYRLMKILGVDIVYNHADYRLLSNRALGHLLEFSEVNLFLRGIVPLLGFKSTKLYYKRSARVAGQSKYPFFKMLSFAIDGITSFSIKPLRILTLIGALISLFSFCVGVWALLTKAMGAAVSGWTSMVVSMYFLGGIQLLGLGIIGEYIGKIYRETKRRPLYFVEEIL